MEVNKKSNKVLIVLVVVLSILLLGAVGYICYDKFFTNDEKENSGIISVNEEESIDKNIFSISDVECVVENEVCVKEFEVMYNGENHNVVLKQSHKDIDNSYSFVFSTDVYIDDVLVNTIDNGEYDKLGNLDAKVNYTELSGNIYIFDGKYLGILIGKFENGKMGEYLYFYNDGKYIQDAVEHVVEGYNGIYTEDNEPTEIEFDGKTMKYWTHNCNKTDQIYEKVSLKFDGEKITKTIVETSGDMQSTFGCS